MTGPAPLLIIIDDKRTDYISFGPTDWNISTLAPWFNGTEQAPGFASQGSGQFGTISMNFQGESFVKCLFELNRNLLSGTSVAFFGVTPQVFNDSQILTVSIDGSQPTNTSYDDPNPPSYRQLYQSPTLSDGSHQISLSHLAGTSLDFAVVTVGNNTPLASQVAIVDNEDPLITFKGNWESREASFTSGQSPDGFPFHNSTQDSTTIGDNLTFSFTGTACCPTHCNGSSFSLGQSAAIYGIFNWSNLGLLTLTFIMDDSSLSRTFQVTATTPQFQSQLGQQQNFQFFSYDFLQPGNHTLVVNVTNCVNQTFSFDYITFAPSFSTLATRPNLTSLTDTVSNDSSSSHKLSAGAIAGIAIVVIIVSLGGVLFSRRQRRKKISQHSISEPFISAIRFLNSTKNICSQPIPSQTS